jgi:hypothetical protein
MFMAGYSVSGTCLWANVYGGELLSSGDTGAAVSIDSDGMLGLAGRFASVWQLDASVGGSGYFIAGFSIAGSAPPIYRWCKRAQTINNSSALGLAFDMAGHVIDTGSFSSATDFGGISITAPGGSTGSFVAQYSK